MKKPYSPEELKTAVRTMQEDSRFGSQANTLIIQHARISRVSGGIEKHTLTEEDAAVELNRIFQALLAIAARVGIENFFEFAGLQEIEETE